LAEFSKLIDTKGWQEYYSKDYSIYEQSHYAVSQMILQKGENVVQEILLKSKVLSFDEAFETVMGFDLDEYFNILQKDLQNKWRSYNTLALEKNDRTIDYNIRGKCLEEYLAENPNKISAMLDLCLIYENAGKLEKANEKYKLAISKAPENMSVFRKFAAFSERLKDTRVWEKVRAAEELLIISEKRQGHMLPYLIYREFI
jgi:tetratricopeptide (TPR) repeat protein